MKKKLLLASISAVLFAGGNASIQAATSTWNGSADSYFTNAANWSPGFPAAGNDIVLGATSTVDLTGWNSGLGGGYYGLGALTYNSTAGAELLGSDGVLLLGGNLTQNGSGTITNTSVAYDLGGAARIFGGTGSGVVNFNFGSMVNSGAGITVNGGYYTFRGVSGSFDSLTIGSGGTVESTIDFGNLTLPGSGSPSSIGTGQSVTLDGGNWILNTDDPLGLIGDFTDRGALFTKEGGMIWAQRYPSGGPEGFRFDTTNSKPAVLVGSFPMATTWPSDRGFFIAGVCDGSGDVLMILTNGANGYIVGSPTATPAFGSLYIDPLNPLTNVYSKIDIKLTISGQPNGDPDADYTSSNVGRFETGNWGNSWNGTYHTNGGNLQIVAGGIHTRNVVQFYQRHTNPRFWGSDFTVEDGTTVFCGGGGTGNSRLMYMGKDASSKLTIKDGATAVFNQQIRSDSQFAGGRLNSTTYIEAGGTLKFKKSYTSASAGGPIVVTGPIVGQGNGTTAKESVMIVDLPWAKEPYGPSDAAYASPVTFWPSGGQGGSYLDDWTNPNNTTGVKFYPGCANLVINATAPNILGLRVQGYSEFLTNLLSEPRLNGVSGSAGVLTIAITNNATYTVSAGPSATSPIAIGFDNMGGNSAEYLVKANTTATNWGRLVVRNARVKPENGYASPAQNVRALGGTLALDDSASVAVGQLVLSENFTIEMGTTGGGGAKLAFAAGGSWTVGKTLTIANWNGGINGGGPDQIFVGTTANLSAAQLGQVTWINPFGAGNVTGAFQFPTGEIVPAIGQSYMSGPSGGGVSDFQVNVTGVAGQTYVVDRTFNLTPTITWTPVKTNTGSFLFIDTGSAGAPVRFYRVRSQ
jgi:hypothetical protein